MASPTHRRLSPLDRTLDVAPCGGNAVRRAVTTLGGIASIEIPCVVRHRGHSFYQIHVHVKTPQGNIPTSRFSSPTHTSVSSSSTAAATPIAVTYQRFGDFRALHRELYDHAVGGDAECLCALCSYMAKLLDFGRDRPRLRVKLFQSDAVACRTLESFVNGLLKLVQDTTSASPTRRRAGRCGGSSQIPLLLKQFLFDEESDSQPAPTLRPSARRRRR